MQLGRSFYVISLPIFALWLATMGLLVQHTFFSPAVEAQRSPPLSPAVLETVAAGEEWMGVYLRGEKIGYTTSVRRQSGEGLHLSEKGYLVFNVLDTRQQVWLQTEALLGADLSLKRFDFSMQSGAVVLKVQGRAQGGELQLDIMSGGRSRRQTLPLPASTHLGASLRPWLIRHQLQPGRRFSLPYFDPTLLRNGELTVEVLGMERLRIGGREEVAYRLRQSLGTLVSQAWVSREGVLLREESPTGFVLQRESRVEALSIPDGGRLGADILAASAVPSNAVIPEPRRLTYLKVRLLNLPPSGFAPGDGWQRWQGGVLEIGSPPGTPRPSRSSPAVSAVQLEPFLQPSPFIQSDDPALIKLARQIIGDTGGGGYGGATVQRQQAVDRLLSWVYANIEKRPVISIPSALEVLRTRVGDCNEHATLFTALSRAAGIPTRMAAGLLYMGGSFYYHAWAEVYLGDSWVPVDPLLNQRPADATHIKLLEGGLDRQIELLRVIGRLQVEVLEFRQG